MERCEYYHEDVVLYAKMPCRYKTLYRCYATKNCEGCTCCGDESKCDFYPEVRKEARKMNTAEMYIEANSLVDDTIVFYTPGRGFKYSVQDGFTIEEGVSIEELMELEWEKCHDIVMTREEAENKYGIKIIDEYPKKTNTRIGYSTAPKAVCQMDMEGHVLKEWRTLSEAADALNIAIGNLSTCCNKGRPKTVGGYRWKFKEEE